MCVAHLESIIHGVKTETEVEGCDFIWNIKLVLNIATHAQTGGARPPWATNAKNELKACGKGEISPRKEPIRRVFPLPEQQIGGDCELLGLYRQCGTRVILVLRGITAGLGLKRLTPK